MNINISKDDLDIVNKFNDNVLSLGATAIERVNRLRLDIIKEVYNGELPIPDNGTLLNIIYCAMVVSAHNICMNDCDFELCDSSTHLDYVNAVMSIVEYCVSHGIGFR